MFLLGDGLRRLRIYMRPFYCNKTTKISLEHFMGFKRTSYGFIRTGYAFNNKKQESVYGDGEAVLMLNPR